MGENFLVIPAELILYICAQFKLFAPVFGPMTWDLSTQIVSFLDLPDLATVARLSPNLAILASDPILHRNRVRVITPSRVKYALFGTGPQDTPLRPTIEDLVQRGVFRGLAIERRLRMGDYFCSQNSIMQYENALRLARSRASHLISTQLRKRSTRKTFLDSISHVLPNVESTSHTISRMLLPAIHKLKWSFQRDKLAKMVKRGCSTISADGFPANFADWRERKGHNVIEDGERVRLAICPDVRKIVLFYEKLTNRSV